MAVFGLDFGTTNSLATIIEANEPLRLTDEATNKPHPSSVWYRGTETIVGPQARSRLEFDAGGTSDGFVRSPKMLLRRDGPLHLGGKTLDATDVVTEVFAYLREHAAAPGGGRPGHRLERAVVTIPVDFGGVQRRALRAAARKAGIGVVQFVHEPAAALYAYLRSKADFGAELAQLENRFILVADWGGGTLDLTLCKISGGSIVQVASAGDNTIGGDFFDDRLLNFARSKFGSQSDIDNVIQLERPGMAAKLLLQCEGAKIALSQQATSGIVVRDYVRAPSEQHSSDLLLSIDRAELDKICRPLVDRGLGLIDRLLQDARLDYAAIDRCIPTGGMVNMPMIRQGLVGRFGGRVPPIENGDSIISEGAAWIAHDGTRLRLSKPIEVRVADESASGHYHVLVPASVELPVENQSAPFPMEQFVCADPRNGVAVFEFAKPRGDDILGMAPEREPLGKVILPVDPHAPPLIERLSCSVVIDHDYVARVEARSKLRGAIAAAEFHQLEFGLDLPGSGNATPQSSGEESIKARTKTSPVKIKASATNVAFRANIVRESEADNRKAVAGDLAYELWPLMFDTRSQDVSEWQRKEQMYYRPCSYCHRSAYDIADDGRLASCPPNCTLASASA